MLKKVQRKFSGSFTRSMEETQMQQRIKPILNGLIGSREVVPSSVSQPKRQRNPWVNTLEIVHSMKGNTKQSIGHLANQHQISHAFIYSAFNLLNLLITAHWPNITRSWLIDRLHNQCHIPNSQSSQNRTQKVEVV